MFPSPLYTYTYTADKRGRCGKKKRELLNIRQNDTGQCPTHTNLRGYRDRPISLKRQKRWLHGLHSAISFSYPDGLTAEKKNYGNVLVSLGCHRIPQTFCFLMCNLFFQLQFTFSLILIGFGCTVWWLDSHILYILYPLIVLVSN